MKAGVISLVKTFLGAEKLCPSQEVWLEEKQGKKAKSGTAGMLFSGLTVAIMGGHKYLVYFTWIMEWWLGPSHIWRNTAVLLQIQV